MSWHAYGVDADGDRHPLTTEMVDGIDGQRVPSARLDDGRTYERVELYWHPEPPPSWLTDEVPGFDPTFRLVGPTTPPDLSGLWEPIERIARGPATPLDLGGATVGLRENPDGSVSVEPWGRCER